MALFETKRVTLSEEAWADIRELSVTELQEADEAGTATAARLMAMLPEKFVEGQMDKSRETATEQVVRYEGYDPMTLLKYGMTGWSFEEPFDEEHRNNLSARYGEVIAKAIFELSVIPSGEAKASSLKSAEAESLGVSDGSTPSTAQEATSA